MPKAKTKPKTLARKSPQAANRSKARGALASKPTSHAKNGPDTKHARIIAMLRAPAGVTIAAMMAATQWQPHSVRGFLAGVVRKKLGLNLVSEKADGGRIYRIKEGKASSVTAVKAA